MTMSYAALLAGVLLVVYFANKTQSYYNLRSFGGHWSCGWSRLWLFLTHHNGEMHLRFTEINDKHGSTARIGPKMLITTDPDLFRRMNAVRSSFTRGPWYTSLKLHPERDNIACTIDEAKHARLRAQMTAGYSGKENLQLEQDVDELLLEMLDLIRTEYLSKPEDDLFRTMDLSKVMSYFTLDVLSKIAFGQTCGFMALNGDRFGYLENLKTFLPAVGLFGVFTELTNITKIPFIKAALPSSVDKRGLGRVMGFARDRVQERFGKNAVVRRDMINSFIKHGLTSAELEGETILQITVGSDSSASALRMTLHYISTSPPVMERLLDEVNIGIATGCISRPIIKDAEAYKLPYLQACIKEGLRMYPPVAGLVAKMVPKGGAKISVNGEERFIPGGTQIAWNSWGMMRNKDIFGLDSEHFRPERWIEDSHNETDQARLSRMNDTLWLCFGYGRFGCLGKGVALMELNKALVEILLRFNLQPCSLARPFKESCAGFYIHENMNFIVTERPAFEMGRRDSLHLGKSVF